MKRLAVILAAALILGIAVNASALGFNTSGSDNFFGFPDFIMFADGTGGNGGG